MKRIFFVLIGFIFSFPALGQEVNSYKYVVVPDKFDFTKETNQYQINSLTEFLFHKYGFDAFLEGEKLPEEIEKDECSALYADVEDNSGLFVTRLNVTLKDCRNNKIFVSEEGLSRSKDYKAAYHEALREAFESVEKLNYSFKPTNINTAKTKTIDSAMTVPEMKTVIVTAIPKVPIDEIFEKETSGNISDSEKIEFTKDGNSFYLKRSGKGFDFFQNEMTEPFASLIPSQTNNSFIYSSVRNQGIASFKNNGDLVIEIFQRETNSTETRIFNRRK